MEASSKGEDTLGAEQETVEAKTFQDWAGGQWQKQKPS